jgi:hypothetical protein
VVRAVSLLLQQRRQQQPLTFLNSGLSALAGTWSMRASCASSSAGLTSVKPSLSGNTSLMTCRIWRGRGQQCSQGRGAAAGVAVAASEPDEVWLWVSPTRTIVVA